MTQYTAETFKPYINDPFHIDFDNGTTLELKLESVNESPHLDTEKYINFDLVFSCAKEMALLQANFPLKHEHLGCVSLFLVPIGEEGDRLFYQSVFNIMRNPEEVSS